MSTTDDELFGLIDVADAWARAQPQRTVRAGLPRVAGARAAVAMRGAEAVDLLLINDGGWTVAGESDERATTFAFLSGWYSLGSQSFALPADATVETWVIRQPSDMIVSALVAPHLRRGLAPARSYALPGDVRVAVGFDDPPLWLVLDRTRQGFTLRASSADLTPEVLLHGLTSSPGGDAFDRAVEVAPDALPVDVAVVDAAAPQLDMLLGHIQASVAKSAVPGVAPAELAAAVVSGVAQAIAGRPLEARKPIDWATVVRALGLTNDDPKKSP